jgi:diguanylate cyclase (GGDEF)-like protein/PAS domain S-box-containing protein
VNDSDDDRPQGAPDGDPAFAEWSRERLVGEILDLRERLNIAPAFSGTTPGSPATDDWERFRTRLSTVSVPPGIAPAFLKAQEYVARYFQDRVHRPDEATISIAGERYVLLRAASMSVEFVELVMSLYPERGPIEARSVANNLLFDLAHAIGKADARRFHEKMGVSDPIERLSAGPIHFAFSGWAYVDIHPESRPSPDEDYFLIFDHPFSFESHAWLAKGRTSDVPVCIMNAGYSSGWCEESFGVPLVSAEIECVAAGGAHCRFIMAPPSRIEEHLARHVPEAGARARRSPAPAVAVPEFFQRRRLEEELRKANELLEARVRERTAELSQSNQRLQHEIAERRLAEEQLGLLGSAVENASEGIFILATGAAADPARITFVNQGLCRMTGRRAEDLVGRTLEVLGVALDERPVLDSLARSLGEGRAFQAEATALRADGSEYALELHVMPAGDGAARSGHWIGILRDVSERKSQLAELRRQALHDALTDLPNRLLLYDRLEQEILKAGRSARPLGLLFMDLNGFKEINDTFGHHCGDQLLRQVGGRLSRALRSTDTVARLGGDEFAILLPEISGPEAATAVAQSLLDALVEPFAVEGQRLTVGASLGIVFSPSHGSDPTTLMRRADVAMYVAKHASRGYAVYAAEADAHSPQRLSLLGDLRRESTREQFRLHFQPEVDLATRGVRRAEALVRWQHPELGLLPPKDFIPLAETGNLMQAVTEWVLDAAVIACKRWQAEGFAFGVSVNLSPRSLRDATLPEAIAARLRNVDLEPRWLTLEITEGSLLADPEHATAVLQRVLELGVELSIDDFGTGYSTLAHLKQLPASEIKIDRSFVRDMTRDEHDAAIVRSIVDLGHNVGRRIVAEGIEDEATWRALAAMGCDLGQGFWISPPLPESELLEWLQSSPGARRGA